MSYQNRPDYRQPFEQLAGEREQEDSERQVALFVSGSPRQREKATTWLVEYLEEANRETDLVRQWRNVFRGQFPLYPLTFHERATGLLALFQNQPREAAQQALGEAAAGHHSLWRVLCLGLQGYATSADRFFLAAAAARVAVKHWETPTAVGKLREALTQQQGGTIDTLCGQLLLELARDLRPHPALHQLLPYLKKLQRNASLQSLCQELQTRIQAISKNHFPLPALPNEHDESTEPNLPRPAGSAESKEV
ncbi:hypothetical protein [Armatimonas sp.]|uniref:hypothetical protein n=1 Tax=Armatimonas sp. TaxID=1872638 RepID=UPI00286A2A2D|nr:hypothetical protein [Armatimonas sp.]